jgi:hypothetical protein
MRLSPEDIADVKELLETDLPPGFLTSSIAAALREARVLVGRDPSTGTLEADAGRRATWSGALIYLVFCEQIGSCFRWSGAQPCRFGGLRRALVQFGEFSEGDSGALRDLRNRLAHDFTLRPISAADSGYRLRLDGSEHEPVVARFGDEIQIRLPAFDNRIESTFVPNIHRALDEGRLECIHQGAMKEVVTRFHMVVIPPRPGLPS